MEHFVIIVNGWNPLTVIIKRFILDAAAVLDPPLLTQTTIGQMKKFFWIISVKLFLLAEQNGSRSRRKIAPIFWRFKEQTTSTVAYLLYKYNYIDIHIPNNANIFQPL